MSYLTELRDSCLLCVRKHLSQALVLMQEARQGYPLHRWLAVGHMGEAADEALKHYPKLAAEIRQHRLRYMGDANYDVPVMKLIEKATNLVKQESRIHTESDAALRQHQRRAEIGDASDKAAFYARLRRSGDDAVKNHFAGHAKEFIDATKAHDEASAHWHDLRNSFDHDARKQADDRLMSAAERYHKAHRALSDAAHHYGQATGQPQHAGMHLHRGDASVEEHMHALARLHGLPKPTVGHSSKQTHVTVSQRQSNQMPFGFPGVDDFTRSVQHHYKVAPKRQTSGSTTLMHIKLPLDRPKLKMEGAPHLARTPLHEELSREERQALDIMSRKHAAGFGDEFWIEHRRQIKSAEFSQAFEEWANSVGWDGSDEQRQDLWSTYLKSPEFKSRQKSILQIEEREVNPDGSTSCGVFIPLPYDLARQFPDKSLEDDSVPHFTVLYAGALSPEDFRKLVAAVRALALGVKPFWLDLSRYNEFVNPKGQVVAHMMPGLAGSSALARLHGTLRRGLEALDVKIEHHYGPDDAVEKIPVPYEVKFKAHATLAYQPPDQPYNGPKPTGSWLVNEIEVWGHERMRIPLGSIDYSDSGAKLLRSKLEMQARMARKSYPRAVPLPVRSPLTGK